MSDAALHQGVAVLGVRRRVVVGVVVGRRECRTVRRSSLATWPSVIPDHSLTVSVRPISTEASCPQTSSVDAGDPDLEVDLVREHVAVEDALRRAALVGRDHDGEVRVRARPVVSDAR